MSLINTTLLQEYLDYSNSRFMRLGIRSVSMDDIARGLGISKKTLYQHFASKKDLVNKSISRHVHLEVEALDHIEKVADNALDEMASFAEHTVIHFRQIGPALIHDLQKYYRDIWDVVISNHSIVIKTKIEQNIIRGIKEGYYRSDVDADIASKLYVSKSFTLVDEGLFPSTHYPREYLLGQHILYHINGLLSDKGRIYFRTFDLFNTKRNEVYN
jgi:Transcriptional regulator